MNHIEDGPPLMFGDDFTFGTAYTFCWVCGITRSDSEHTDRQAQGCGLHCTTTED